MRHTKYRVKFQKYRFIDGSYCRNGEINTSTVRALKRLKMYVLWVLDIDPVVRTHVFSAILYAKIDSSGHLNI